MKKPFIAVVGAGKVGTALSVLLKNKGYPIVGIASGSPSSAKAAAKLVGTMAADYPEEITYKADLIFITTPDRLIAEVDQSIGQKGGYRQGQIVVHTSGSHPAGILDGAVKAGAFVVSIHPLQSFADVQVAVHNLPGSYFALEGDPKAIPLAEQIVSDLGGNKFTVSAEDKPLYHAGACIASNYLISLIYFCTGLYEKFGLSRDQAFDALYPLIQGTLNNVREVGVVQALTGPISRGDVSTIKSHLDGFENIKPLEKDLYHKLGIYTIQIALAKGSINEAQAKELYNCFRGYRN